MPAILAAVAAGTVAQGGFFASGRILAALLMAVAAGLAWWAGWRPRRTRPAALFGVACGGLALWAVVRAVAAGDSFDVALGAVATLAGVVFVVDAVAQEGPRGRAVLVNGLLLLGGAVGASAWLGVAWRVPRFVELVEERVWRGGATLTYPNAAAAMLAVLALLALATRSPAGTGAERVNVAPQAAAFMMIVGLGATFSRAGALALVVGLVVLAVAAGLRHTVTVALPTGLGALIATAALLPAVPMDSQPRPGLALLGLAGGAFVALAPCALPRTAAPRTATPRMATPRMATPRAAVLVAIAATTVAAGVVVWTVLRGHALGPVLASRFTFESSGRSKGAGAAFDLVRDNPWAGTGLGRSYLFWPTPDGNGAVARFAHNEYLQILVDLGIVGALWLVALIGAAVVLIRRGQPHPLRAGAIAGLAAFAVHSGFDFLWHIAVLPILGGVLLGLAATATRRTGVQGPDTGAPVSSPGRESRPSPVEGRA